MKKALVLMFSFALTTALQETRVCSSFSRAVTMKGLWKMDQIKRERRHTHTPTFTHIHMFFYVAAWQRPPGETIMCDICCLFILIKWQPGSFTDLPTEGAQTCDAALRESSGLLAWTACSLCSRPSLIISITFFICDVETNNLHRSGDCRLNHHRHRVG